MLEVIASQRKIMLMIQTIISVSLVSEKKYQPVFCFKTGLISLIFWYR